MDTSPLGRLQLCLSLNLRFRSGNRTPLDGPPSTIFCQKRPYLRQYFNSFTSPAQRLVEGHTPSPVYSSSTRGTHQCSTYLRPRPRLMSLLTHLMREDLAVMVAEMAFINFWEADRSPTWLEIVTPRY